MATTTPGTYRIDDDSPVELTDAKAAWTPIARDALQQVAGTYGGVVTYKVLAEEIQVTSGIRTRQMLHRWLGDVLGAVSADCHTKSEPLLAALCVQQDGSIGAAYATAFEAAHGTPPPEDIELAAAEERLECYRHFGAVMPADGGMAQFTPEVAKRRTTAKRRAREERVRPTCPSCGINLPASGICDYCN